MSIEQTRKCTRVADRRELFGRGLISRLSSPSRARGYDLGRLHFSLFRAFSFRSFLFSFSCFIGRALLDNGGRRHMETSLLFSYRITWSPSVSPRLRDRNPSIYLIGLGRSCGAFNRIVRSTLRYLGDRKNREMLLARTRASLVFT